MNTRISSRLEGRPFVVSIPQLFFMEYSIFNIIMKEQTKLYSKEFLLSSIKIYNLVDSLSRSIIRDFIVDS